MQSSPPGRLRDRQAELGESDLRPGAGEELIGAYPRESGSGSKYQPHIPWSRGPVCASFEHPALAAATQVGFVLGAPAPWTARPGSTRSVEQTIRPLGGKVATRRQHADASRLRGSRCPCDALGTRLTSERKDQVPGCRARGRSRLETRTKERVLHAR